MICPDCLTNVDPMHAMERECLRPEPAATKPKSDCVSCGGTGWIDDPVSGLSVHCPSCFPHQ